MTTTAWTGNIKVISDEKKDFLVALFLAFHDVKAQEGVKCKNPEKCFLKLIDVIK